MVFEHRPLTLQELCAPDLSPPIRAAMGRSKDLGHPAARAMTLLVNHRGDDASLVNAFWTAVHAKTFDRVIESLLETQLKCEGVDDDKIDSLMTLFRMQNETMNTCDDDLQKRVRIFLHTSRMPPEDIIDWLAVLESFYDEAVTIIQNQGLSGLGISEELFIKFQHETAGQVIEAVPEKVQESLLRMISLGQIQARFDLVVS